MEEGIFPQRLELQAANAHVTFKAPCMQAECA